MESNAAAVGENELGPLERRGIANQIPFAGMGCSHAELSRDVIAREVRAPEHKRHNVRSDEVLIFARVKTSRRIDSAFVKGLVRRTAIVIGRSSARRRQQEQRA